MEKELIQAHFKHKTDIQIRFNDVDSFGHVNNNTYFAYYDLGKESYLNTVLNSDLRTLPIVPVVANISADFILPIFHGDEIQVETAIIHLGTKSFTLLQQAVNKKTGAVLCQCKSIMVCFNAKTQQAEDMPDTYRQAILDYETDNLQA